MPGRLISRAACAALTLLALPLSPQSVPSPTPEPAFPDGETFLYSVEWRLIDAGAVRLRLDANKDTAGWQASLHLRSSGLVSKLYHLDDHYKSQFQDEFCTSSTSLDAIERSRHHDTQVTFDAAHGKANYVERDLIRNRVFKTAETPIPACTSDIISALYKLRTLKLDPGQHAQIAMSDGKKSAAARVDAQQREQIKTAAGTFSAVRHEVFVFNGVLYARKAQLLVWLSDDARRIPVQIRVRLGFPVGSITVQLEKEEHS